MKNFLIILLSILISGSAIAQCSQLDFEIITTNFDSYDVISGSTGLFLPNSDTQGGISLVDDESKSTIYAGAAWIAGVDPEGKLNVTAPFYHEPLNSGYYPDDGSPIDCQDWNRTFQVLKEEVDLVIADYEDNGQIDNIIPNNIYYYPAKGNEFFYDHYGFQLPAENIGGLAPFVDRDNDEIYNPEKGDYPVIKGDVANYNFAQTEDLGYVRGVAVEMNMQSNHWAIRDSTLQNSYDMQLTYQGTEVLKDAYISLWLDADNICYSNADIGCLSDNNIAFMYGDYEDGCDGYAVDMTSTQTPMVIAEGTVDGNSMSSFITMHRIGTGDAPPGSWIPETEQEFYNCMQGHWRDGLALTHGGIGYNIGNTDTTSFLLDHSENAEFGPWSTCEDDNPNHEGDKNLLLNFGPLTIEPNQLLDIKLNTYFIYNTGYTCPNEEQILEQLDRAKDPIIVNTKQFEVTEENILVSPNPFTAEMALKADSDIQDIQVYDVQGNKIYHTQNINAKSIRVFTNEWISGVYTLKVKTNESIQMVKVIKI